MSIHEISRPVCILGLGLIGGSLLRALVQHNVPAYGFNRSPSAARAAAKEGFDVSSDLTATLRRAEQDNALIVLATPMPAIESLLIDLQTHAPTCGFTDVVSVKGEVYDLVKAHGMEDRYVGSHPMAGTANSGWKASFPELFQNAVWVVTFDYPLDFPHRDQGFWLKLWTDVVHMATLIGSEVIPARVETHDAAVARISHLPHLLAEALAIVGDNGGALSLSLAAGSYRDGTRVAGSAPSLVRAMCETNHAALLDALDECLNLLHDARAHLAEPHPNLEELIDNGYRSRIRFEARAGLNSKAAHVSHRPVFRLHPGGENWISQLKQAEGIGARIEAI